jgi:amino acid adenylation domain-containing protein
LRRHWLGGIDRWVDAALNTPTQTRSFQNRETSSLSPVQGSANLPSEEAFGYPLSSAQRRLWFLDQLFPGTPLYNLPLVVHLQQAIDPFVVRDCLFAIGQRHETFRTIFRFFGGEPVQVISAAPLISWRIVAFENLPVSQRRAAAQALAEQESAQPFDLARGPLWRCTLIRLAAADHLLLITAHHIVSDGWSMGLLLRELRERYAASAAGCPPPIAELPIQYLDYAIWQQERINSGALLGDLSYWRGCLADLPELELPADRPRTGNATLRGRRLVLSVSAEVRRGIEAFSRDEGVTPFMVLISAFALLLYRYTGQSDLPIGTTVAGRTRVEFESLIGLFVNTLVLRIDLGGDPTFRELVGRVREMALEAYMHQELPFDKLVEHLQPDRDLGRNPLFQVMFTMQNAPTAPEERGETLMPLEELDSGVTNFDLAFDVWPSERGYGVRIEYSLDRFEGSSIARMGQHWCGLLSQVAEASDRRSHEFRIIDTAERQRVIEVWNQNKVDFGAAETLHGLVQSQARRSPCWQALVSAEGELTYDELDKWSDSLARELCSALDPSERSFVVLLDRSFALAASLLAIWKAGGVYVPVDPREPTPRLHEFVAQLEPAAILYCRTSEDAAMRIAQSLGCSSRDTLLLVSVEATRPDLPAGAPEMTVAPSQLAYIIHTSGTIGPPKGVMVEHQALVNQIRWMQSRFPLGPGDRILAMTNPAFDVSLWELVAPLASGAALFFPPAGADLGPRRVVQIIAEQKICAVQTTPSFLRQMLDSPDLGHCEALRWVFCGAESMPRALVEHFSAGLPRASLHNMYGPTECAIDAACYDCPSGKPIPETRSGTVPIGRPIANVQLYVLDAALDPAPPGMVGELYIAGANLARGYWRQPEFTAQRFIPNPFGPPGARMYKTGDRVRHLPSGDLEVLGRVDRQVKVRGVRVELAEIENVLVAHPDVREAALRSSGDHGIAIQLLAYVAGDTQRLSIAELRRHAADRLPGAMVPNAFVLLDMLPRTARGKVDYSALKRVPLPDQSNVSYIAPRNETEAALVDIWQNLLGVTRVGAGDDFFLLGGHSLMAMQMVSRLLDRFGLTVPLRAVFEARTVTGLAGLIDSTRCSPVTATADSPLGTSPSAPLPEAASGFFDGEVDQILRVLIEREGSL